MNDFATSTSSSPTPVAPKTFGQILDRTSRLMRTHFKLLVGIAAFPSILMMLAIGLMEAVIWIPMIRQFPQQPTPQAMFHNFTSAVLILVFVAFSLLCLVIFSIYLAAASYASTRADSGVKVTVGEAYSLALRQKARYLWLMVLMHMYLYVPLAAVLALVGLAAALLHFVAGVGAGSWSMFFLVLTLALLYLGFLVYAILIMLRFALAFPACVVEDLPAWASMQRSAKLTSGAKGRIFLVILVVYAALYAAMLAIELLAILLGAIGAIVMMVLHAHVTAPWSYIGLGAIGICAFAGMVLFISLTYAALVTALAVLYNDQRLRKDGPLPASPQAGNLS
jgi:MFS family permease